ncbi:MAG: ABC transporter ATP-binding protein [Acidimicrobiia bacterium]
MPLSPEPGPAIRCRLIDKRYGTVVALDHFSLEVTPGSILGLLGPSGCGKTTALRVMAGFEHPDAGTVEVGGRLVAGPGRFVPAERRRVGMVFQDYALFPHMTVAHNVGYGLARSERTLRVAEVMELVGLSGLERRMPHQLSGGEQQRVALARALAPIPEVILLDEPFSNLDAPQRDRVRREVRAILLEAGITAVFVTHDQEEALAMSDVVAVMRAGGIVQLAPPHELYRRPTDAWVAGFLGDAEFLPGLARHGKVETLLGTFQAHGPAGAVEGPVEVMVRPEAVRLTADREGEAVVIAREFYGHDQVVVLELDSGRRLNARLGPSPVYPLGERVSITVEDGVSFPLG